MPGGLTCFHKVISPSPCPRNARDIRSRLSVLVPSALNDLEMKLQLFLLLGLAGLIANRWLDLTLISLPFRLGIPSHRLLTSLVSSRNTPFGLLAGMESDRGGGGGACQSEKTFVSNISV
jgi:hypothetical protein